MKKVLGLAGGFILALIGACLVQLLIPHPIFLGERGILYVAIALIMVGAGIIGRILK